LSGDNEIICIDLLLFSYRETSVMTNSDMTEDSDLFLEVVIDMLSLNCVCSIQVMILIKC